jgi:3',5'-cyclic AMP phosphodiesterase CpdA
VNGRILIGQLTDPHISGADDGSASAEALKRAVRTMLAARPQPDAVLVTGDLAEAAADAEYELVRELLAPLARPVHVLSGNHDQPDVVRRHFGLPGSTGEPLRYSVWVGPLRVVLCDTTLPGRDDGRLDPERLEWLDAELAAERQAPTIVAMHHSPLVTGLRAMDEIGLPAGDRVALATLMTRHEQVLRIVSGHVHRAAVAALGGCPVFACPSTHQQLLLDFELPPDFAVGDDPPAIALHLFQAGELTSHLQPVN